jgi:hypothetical protein
MEHHRLYVSMSPQNSGFRTESHEVVKIAPGTAAACGELEDHGRTSSRPVDAVAAHTVWAGVNFYLNGVEYSTRNDLGSDGSGSKTDDNGITSYIGNRDDLIRAFNGSIDDVRVYNRALSAGEINKLYQMGR